MLKAIYELDRDVPADKVVEVGAERGQVRFSICPTASIEDVIFRMNEAARKLCRGSGWLQLWDGGVDIVDITFELRDLPPGPDVAAPEIQGQLLIIVRSHISVARFVAAMNPTSETVLAGGQLYQLWQGEIVSNASPETAPSSS